METAKDLSVAGVVRATFRELPGWEKLVVIAVCAMLSPLAAIVAALLFMALFPLVLLGRFEGDLGESPGMREVARRVRRREARTARYYAS